MLVPSLWCAAMHLRSSAVERLKVHPRSHDDHVPANGAMNEEEPEEESGALTVAEKVDLPLVGTASDTLNDEGDGSLQQRADKYSLSAINVRSIIHVRV